MFHRCSRTPAILMDGGYPGPAPRGLRVRVIPSSAASPFVASWARTRARGRIMGDEVSGSVLRDLRSGLTRADALRRMADRLDVTTTGVWHFPVTALDDVPPLGAAA